MRRRRRRRGEGEEGEDDDEEKQEEKEAEGQEAPYNWLTPDRPPLAASTGIYDLFQKRARTWSRVSKTQAWRKQRVSMTPAWRCPKVPRKQNF